MHIASKRDPFLTIKFRKLVYIAPDDTGSSRAPQDKRSLVTSQALCVSARASLFCSFISICNPNVQYLGWWNTFRGVILLTTKSPAGTLIPHFSILTHQVYTYYFLEK